MSKRQRSPDFLRIYAFASNWVTLQMQPFTAEDMKVAFLEKNDPPEKQNTFGGVITTLAVQEAIFKTDRTVTAKLPSARHNLRRVWISKEYRLRQKNNRLAPYKQQTQLF